MNRRRINRHDSYVIDARHRRVYIAQRNLATQPELLVHDPCRCQPHPAGSEQTDGSQDGKAQEVHRGERSEHRPEPVLFDGANDTHHQKPAAEQNKHGGAGGSARVGATGKEPSRLVFERDRSRPLCGRHTTLGEGKGAVRDQYDHP